MMSTYLDIEWETGQERDADNRELRMNVHTRRKDTLRGISVEMKVERAGDTGEHRMCLARREAEGVRPKPPMLLYSPCTP